MPALQLASCPDPENSATPFSAAYLTVADGYTDFDLGTGSYTIRVHASSAAKDAGDAAVLDFKVFLGAPTPPIVGKKGVLVAAGTAPLNSYSSLLSSTNPVGKPSQAGGFTPSDALSAELTTLFNDLIAKHPLCKGATVVA